MIDGDLYVIQKLIYQMQLMSYGLQTFLQTNSANCSANHLYRLGIAAVKESILEGLKRFSYIEAIAYFSTNIKFP